MPPYGVRAVQAAEGGDLMGVRPRALASGQGSSYAVNPRSLCRAEMCVDGHYGRNWIAANLMLNLMSGLWRRQPLPNSIHACRHNS